jgi:hypothetical protein
MQSIFSNNVIVEYPEIQPDFPLSRLAHALPHLATLGLDPNMTLSVVKGAKVFELQSTLGTLSFGHGVAANASIAVWARPLTDRFEPLIAEFGFSTKPAADEHNEKAQKRADEFFKALQIPLKEYLSDGTTKTALIYGDEAS